MDTVSIGTAFAYPPVWIAFAFTSILLFRVWKAVRSPLRAIPGPVLARFSRSWLLYQVHRKTFHLTNVELHKRYGPIVRIAPNEFSIDDPSAVPIIYGSGKSFAKSDWYAASGIPNDPHPDTFSDRDNVRHAANRRKVAQAYSMTSMTQLQEIVDPITELLCQRLDELAETRASFSITHWVQCYAFDVVGAVTFGERFGFLDKGQDIGGMMRGIQSILKYVVRMGIFPELHPYFFWLGPLFLPALRNLQKVHDFASENLKKRLETVSANDEEHNLKDFASRLISVSKKSPEKISTEDLFVVCITNIGAGSDTTAVSLTSVIYHLWTHPIVLHRLREELREAEEAGDLQYPVSAQAAQKLTYLQAVLREALRCHSATGLPLGRVVPDGGAYIAGHFFPPGTVVGINAWVAHANTAVFGEDAHLFRPERWIDDRDAVQKRNAYFMAFGAGARTCLGKNLSLLEMSKSIPELVKRFDFEFENPEEGMIADSVWFTKPTNLMCRSRRRQSNR